MTLTVSRFLDLDKKTDTVRNTVRTIRLLPIDSDRKRKFSLFISMSYMMISIVRDTPQNTSFHSHSMVNGFAFAL